MIQKKYLFILIGFALMLQGAADDGQQGDKFSWDFRYYIARIISLEELKTRLASYTQAELNSPDGYGQTPLLSSVGYRDVFKLLLDAGADFLVQANGKDVLTLVFKKAYTDGADYNRFLNWLKEKANMNEEDVFNHALKQEMVFDEEDVKGFEIECGSSMLPISAFPPEERARRDEERAGRDYEMVRGFIFPPDGCLIKGAKKK